MKAKTHRGGSTQASGSDMGSEMESEMGPAEAQHRGSMTTTMGDAPSRGRLWVVATPIGNLQDITLRAIDALKRCDRVVAEDTRHSGKLLHHFGVDKPLASLHAHSNERQVAHCIAWMQAGETLALVSDAGSPVISDPGMPLVQAAIEADIPVTVIPGVSSVTTALSASGLACGRFAFYGFLPRKGAERRAWLSAIAHDPKASVLFESPHRIRHTLTDFQALLAPQRRIAMCRELTKMHEEVLRGTTSDVLARLPATIRGEVTLVIEESFDAASTSTKVPMPGDTVRGDGAGPGHGKDHEAHVECDPSATPASLIASWVEAEPHLSTKALAVRLSNVLSTPRSAAYAYVLRFRDEHQADEHQACDAPTPRRSHT